MSPYGPAARAAAALLLAGCVSEDIVASWSTPVQGVRHAVPAGAISPGRPDAAPQTPPGEARPQLDEPPSPAPPPPPPGDEDPPDPPPPPLGEGALCACDDMVTSSQVSVIGDLGTGGRLQVDQGITVSGDVTVSGPLGMNSGGDVTIGGDLRCAGALTSDGAVIVQGDAYIAGEIRVPSLQVGGRLTVLPDAPLTGDLDAGAMDTQDAGAEAFDIQPPCICPAPLPPPGPNADVRAVIAGPAALTVRLPGPWPVELYVDGAVTADLTLAPMDLGDEPPPAVDARLIIGGGLGAAPPLIAQEMPADSVILLHVAGGEVLSFDQPAPWPGAYRYHLIAAEAELVVGAALGIQGRWHVRRIAADSPITVSAPEP